MSNIKEIELLFDEASHTYSADGKIYTSVTTLIGKYTDTFNDYYWAMYTGLKNHGFNVKPDMKYIFFEGKDLSFSSPGIYRVFLLDDGGKTVTSGLVEIISK